MDKLTASQIIQFAGLLIGLGSKFIETKAANEGKPIDEVLLEANDTWNQAQREAEDLLKQGHS